MAGKKLFILELEWGCSDPSFQIQNYFACQIQTRGPSRSSTVLYDDSSEAPSASTSYSATIQILAGLAIFGFIGFYTCYCKPYD